MKNSKLKALVFSDVHLYHNKTKTEHIVRGLYKALPNNESMRDVDIIFISGDLFDHTVLMSNKDTYFVIKLIYHILGICERYDIVLRILEGTPSHDWKQSKIFIEINESLSNPVDVRHVVNLSIEHIERFGINVLYVPDEWGSGCSDTFLEVKELLTEANLEQVDLSIMHGCFNYQFPVNLVGKPDVHDENSYLSITKYLVIIGHYHTPSIFERIYVPGSFDRLKHGEEERKGHLEIMLYKDGAYDVKFIENKSAMLYKTYDFAGWEVGDVVNYLKREYVTPPEECHIRVLANKDDAVYHAMADLKRTFPFAHFTVSLKEKTKEKEKTVSETKDIVRPSSLSSDNIITLMMARLTDKHPSIASECITALRNVMSND